VVLYYLSIVPSLISRPVFILARHARITAATLTCRWRDDHFLSSRTSLKAADTCRGFHRSVPDITALGDPFLHLRGFFVCCTRLHSPLSVLSFFFDFPTFLTFTFVGFEFQHFPLAAIEAFFFVWRSPLLVCVVGAIAARFFPSSAPSLLFFRLRGFVPQLWCTFFYFLPFCRVLFLGPGVFPS